MISRFYFYSPVFLEYGLSETKHSVSSHIIHWIRGENTTCTLGIYYCLINFDSMCLAFQWNTVLRVSYKCSNKLILMYKKLRMQKQGGFHQITFHDLLINRASDISRGCGPAKFRYFREIPRNSLKKRNTAKSARNISKYMSAKHI